MREYHPYGEYIPEGANAIIIGSFPIGKFSDPGRHHEILPHEIEFFFGGSKNLLWKILGEIFEMPVSNKSQIKKLLSVKKLGVGDVIKSCVRREGRASDSDLFDIEWNTDLLKVIRRKKIKTIFYTSKKVKTWFEKLFPETDDLTKILLISPSGQTLRALYHHPDFAKWMSRNPDKKSYDFVVYDYKQKFETIG